jgi:hypothetical protein
MNESDKPQSGKRPAERLVKTPSLLLAGATRLFFLTPHYEEPVGKRYQTFVTEPWNDWYNFTKAQPPFEQVRSVLQLWDALLTTAKPIKAQCELDHNDIITVAGKSFKNRTRQRDQTKLYLDPEDSLIQHNSTSMLLIKITSTSINELAGIDPSEAGEALVKLFTICEAPGETVTERVRYWALSMYSDILRDSLESMNEDAEAGLKIIEQVLPVICQAEDRGVEQDLIAEIRGDTFIRADQFLDDISNGEEDGSTVVKAWRAILSYSHYKSSSDPTLRRILSIQERDEGFGQVIHLPRRPEPQD